MVRGHGVGFGGGAPRRASAGPASAAAAAAAARGDENAPPGGSSAATSAAATAPRPPLRAIQPRPAPAASSRKHQWPLPAPSKSQWARAAGKGPARPSTSLVHTKNLRKPALRLGLAKAGAASSAEVPPSKVRAAITFWEENRNVQNVLSTLQQYDSHAPAKIEGCSGIAFIRDSEDILSLQLELDILKTILVEAVKDHAEVCRQKEATENELDVARTCIETLEAQLTDKIKEVDELKKNNFQSPVLCKKRDMETPWSNSKLDIPHGNEYVPYEEPKMQTLKCLVSEESSLGTKLKRMQASLEKSRNLNTRYQQDLASCSSAERKKDEVCRQVEIETSKVIISLKEQLSSVNLQLNASKKNELLAKQNLDEICRIEFLLEESIETLVQKEVLEQNYVSLLRWMGTEICQLESQLDQSKRFYEGRLKQLEKKMQEKDDMAAASLISWNKEKEVAEERKTYAEEKDEEIKLLERSIEDLEITVCSLENKVDTFKEEAEQQRWQREKLETELQNVRQQLLAVPSSSKEESSLEDGMVDSPDSTSHPNDINNGLRGAQRSRRIGRNQVSVKESEVDIMKEEVEHQRWQQGKIDVELQNVRQQVLVVPSSEKARSFLENGIVDLADLTRHQNDMNSELLIAQDSRIFQREVSVEHMQEADQSDVGREKAQLSNMDYLSDDSKFEHPSASEKLEQISANKQPEFFGNGADSDRSLSAFDSEQVRPPGVEPMIEVLEENELPPVAPVRHNDPVDYTRAPSDELKRLRSRNHYEGPRTATDKRFWSIEQQDLYTSIYSRAKLFDMKWIDWDHIDSIDQFACVREQFAHLGLEEIMSYCCDWDSELIRQFYSTVYISNDKSTMTCMADGRRITTNKRAWEDWFGIPGGFHTDIHSEFLLDDDGKRTLYTASKCTLGQVSGLSPLASIANKIIRTTIYPKSGNTLHGHNWNLIYHIVEQHPFDIIALIFGEVELLISDRNRTKDLLLYAPYIMSMIMRAFEYNGPRESRHHPYKPRHTYKLKQTKKVSRPPAHAVAAPFEKPPSALQPEVEGRVVADNHHQFEAAGHQPQGKAVQGQAVLAQAITSTYLLQVVEDGLRPIRDSLASMEGRIGRVEGGPILPVQHTKSSSSSQIPAPHSSLALPLQATTPASAASFEQTSRFRSENSGASSQPALVTPSPFTQPVLGRPSPFSRFRWYQREK